MNFVIIIWYSRTWDFGGQREYYATHQYFLSKRSLYLVVWKIPDGQKGISEIFHWLVNIQVSKILYQSFRLKSKTVTLEFSP